MPAVRLLVDDEEVPGPTRQDLAARRLLSDLLPASARDPRTWRSVEATGTQERRLTLRQPTLGDPGQDVLVTIDQRDSVSLLVARPDNPALPPEVRAVATRPSVALPDILEIRVRTREAALPPPGVDRTIELRVAGRPPRTISKADLDALPRVAAPEASAKEAEHDLADLVALVVPLDRVAAVTLSLGGAEPAVIDRAQLISGSRRLLVKWNRRGELRVHAWEGDRRVHRYEDVRAIEVAVRP